MNFENDRIYQLIPHGFENRISTELLTNLGGFKTPRHLQKHIEYLRNHSDAVICSTNQHGGGYYVPVTKAEIRAFVRTCENRGRNTIKGLQSAKRMLQEMDNDES